MSLEKLAQGVMTRDEATRFAQGALTAAEKDALISNPAFCDEAAWGKVAGTDKDVIFCRHFGEGSRINLGALPNHCMRCSQGPRAVEGAKPPEVSLAEYRARRWRGRTLDDSEAELRRFIQDLRVDTERAETAAMLTELISRIPNLSEEDAVELGNRMGLVDTSGEKGTTC